MGYRHTSDGRLVHLRPVRATLLVNLWNRTPIGLTTPPRRKVIDSVEGLNVGSDVRLGGIKVGTVVSQELDPLTYLAVVRIGIAEDVRIPTDSMVQVVSEGLLGGRYMAIVPGAEDAMLGPGGEIRYTQSAVNIEQLIGRFAGGD